MLDGISGTAGATADDGLACGVGFKEDHAEALDITLFFGVRHDHDIGEVVVEVELRFGDEAREDDLVFDAEFAGEGSEDLFVGSLAADDVFERGDVRTESCDGANDAGVAFAGDDPGDGEQDEFIAETVALSEGVAWFRKEDGGVEAGGDLEDLVFREAQIEEFGDGELAVGDDGIGGFVDEIADLGLVLALVGEGDVFPVAVCDEGDAEELLEEDASESGGVKVSAVEDVGPARQGEGEGAKHGAGEFGKLRVAEIAEGAEAAKDAERGCLLSPVEGLPTGHPGGEHGDVVVLGDATEEIVVVEARAAGLG